jgi:GTP pyrophosphokinase
MTRVKSLIEKVKSYNPEADVEAIKNAFKLAKKLHADQYRKSGDDFILHPLAVANILAGLEMDTTTIVAALLHDVVEDTGISLSEIRPQVGNEVCLLIDGVTKLGRIEFKSYEEERVENLRKMFVAMAKDIRVILIKLADRLHNMRTVKHLRLEKQRQKARETLEIYAPLAHRLGIMQLKWELEDISFQVLEPKRYAEIQKMVAERRSEREAHLNSVINALKRELGKVGIKANISGRPKHFYSIYQKMIQKGKEFNEIYDLTGVRVIVDTIKDCYGALGTIHTLWKPVPGRFKDYIAMPKFNMYQSLHTTVIGPKGKPLEIQIRTHQMHKTAEYGIAAHWRYKEKAKDDKFDERLAWLRQMLEWQSELKDPREFMEALKIDLFEDEVYVFTPKGDVINLPAGATPIDFAYSIHTDIGNQCIGAKVNNQIVPLEYRLKTGDFVEILTSKSSAGPSKDWLNIVKTSRARSKIKQWFSKERKEASEHEGKELLQKELRKLGLGLKPSAQTELLESIAKEFNFLKIEDLLAAIGDTRISAKQVAHKLAVKVKGEKALPIGEKLEREFPKRKIARIRRKKSGATSVRVLGQENLLTRLAQCCNPVPYEDIVGFITRGRGVSIHKKSCQNVKRLQESPERFIEVSWDYGQPGTFPVEIQVEALDRTKLLRDVSTVLGDAGLNILSASVKTTKDHIAILRFVFEIANLEHLENVLRNVRKVDAVYDARRVELSQTNFSESANR